MLMNVVLLSINIRRVWEIRDLTSEITRFSDNTQISHWLLPLMKHRPVKTVATACQKGEPADRLIYIFRGELDRNYADCSEA